MNNLLSNQETRWVATILLLFLAIGLWYSLAVPPFETPDEIHHYAFVRYVAQGNGLPVQSANAGGLWAQEGSQAPLYYLLTGWLTAAIDQSDFDQLAVFNPRANIGNPLFPGNKNRMLHSAAAYPLRGANLALHIARWFSLLLGLSTLWFTYLTAKLAFPNPQPAAHSRLPLIALAITAAIPQFAFISASCSNDSLITAISAATLWWLARIVGVNNPGISEDSWIVNRKRVFLWLILGILLGLAALSKLQGLGLGLLAGLVALGLAWQQRDWRLPLRAFLPTLLPVLAIAGWWYWRNYTLYADWIGTGHLLANNGARLEPLTLPGLWQEFRGLRFSFWGLFGWFNLLLPIWVYTLLDGVTLLGLVGLLMGNAHAHVRRAFRTPHSAFRIPHSALHILLTLWSLLSLLLLLYWTSQATGSQGRLLFPAIGALVILLVSGLESWYQRLPMRWQSWSRWALPAFLLACSLYTLIYLLPVNYYAPRSLTQIPPSAQPLMVTFGDRDKLTLVGVDLPAGRYQQGDLVPITLYLQTRVAVHEDYQLFIQLLDEQGVEMGNLTSHPGWGRNPTSLWRTDTLYADSYVVPVERAIDLRSPLWARIYVGFVEPSTEITKERLPVTARDQNGAELDPFIAGHVTLVPSTPPQLTRTGVTAVGTAFGNVIQLTSVAFSPTISAGSPLTVTVLWNTVGRPATDYTAYVHLVDGQGKVLGGYDAEPAPLRYPTSQWRTGDSVLSVLPVPLPADLPAGQYAVWIGLYERASQGALRLPITTAANQPTGDGEVQVGVVEIE